MDEIEHLLLWAPNFLSLIVFLTVVYLFKRCVYPDSYWQQVDMGSDGYTHKSQNTAK
jgi:hypothetical protein